MDSIQRSVAEGSFTSSAARAQFVHCYRPLIKTGRTVLVFVRENQLFSKIAGQSAQQLPVHADYPLLSHRSIPELKQSFSGTYPVINEKDGVAVGVRIASALRGGMIGQSDLLLSHDGYAIGNVIHENQILLPRLMRQRAQIEEQWTVNQKASDREKALDEHPQKSRNLNRLDLSMNRLKREHAQITEQLQPILDAVQPVVVERTLPIDYARSRMKIDWNSSGSENMEYMAIDASDSSQAEARVADLISSLFSQDNLSNCLPSQALERITGGIKRMLATENRVCILGSFITLPKSKVLNPVWLRPGAQVPWEENADKYFVFTEAVLGGVFLGYGREMVASASSSSSTSSRADTAVAASQVTTLSYIAQGAIPRTGASIATTSLWGVYSSWKESLEGEHGGYPVGYRYQSLSDVLRENGR